ncbi:MAG TPA: CpsD/CapB family tyrosine-protein kinase [Gemmatimonadales bacterium]|nr:CpsD/CapB family tyrosine-protein kinase [Gemmatimonadales bacterium]
MQRVVTIQRQDPAARLWRGDAVDGHLVGLLDPASFEADRYRTLRHLVERRQSSARTIGVSSAAAGDGKTTTALNLAAVLAEAPGANVVVVDLDLRTPSVGERLGLPPEGPGFVDLLLDPGLTPADVVWRHPAVPLSAVPAGRSVATPYELLRSPRLLDLLHELRQAYDYVIVDTPPVAPVPDARLIAEAVDGLVVVVAAHRTPRSLLEEALNALDPARVIGLVFNGDDGATTRYYGRYYHRHGGRGRDRR